MKRLLDIHHPIRASRIMRKLVTAAVVVVASASVPPVPHDTGGGTAGDASWLWPISPPHEVIRGFEAPSTPYSAGHRGIDIRASAGAPVFAPADGTVFFAGRVVDRPVLSLEHAGDLLSSVEPVETTLKKGQAVHRGDRIGTVGTGGDCSGRCVHFGVRLHGEYVSPMLYLGGIPRAVLLPLG